MDKNGIPNIIIVDENEECCLEYKRVLKPYGYNLIFIRNVEDYDKIIPEFEDHCSDALVEGQPIQASKTIALTILAQELPTFKRFVFEGDYNYQNAQGVMLIQEFRSICKLTRVIIITSKAYREGQCKAWEVGRQMAHGYYSKKTALNSSFLPKLIKGKLREFNVRLTKYNNASTEY